MVVQIVRRLDAAEVKDLFSSRAASHYRKSGTFLARFADCDETILTIVAGQLETLKRATWGDVVLINIAVGQQAERYIISGDKFRERYIVSDETMFMEGRGWKKVSAAGWCHAWEYDGESLIFTAPWGEDMILSRGDYLASTGGSDIYRIERKAFLATYAAAD